MTPREAVLAACAYTPGVPVTDETKTLAVEIVGDQAAIREGLAGYDNDMAAFQHDNTVQCAICQRRWFSSMGNDTSMMNAEASERGDANVCEDCAPEAGEYFIDVSPEAMRREHGTWGA
jgi:hypothetical protein